MAVTYTLELYPGGSGDTPVSVVTGANAKEMINLFKSGSMNVSFTAANGQNVQGFLQAVWITVAEVAGGTLTNPTTDYRVVGKLYFGKNP